MRDNDVLRGYDTNPGKQIEKVCGMCINIYINFKMFMSCIFDNLKCNLTEKMQERDGPPYSFQSYRTS